MMNNDPRLTVAIAQIEAARNYTSSLLADVGDDDWYQMPAGAPTHLAWQVGHIAMAQYGLALFRQRGRKPEDGDLMSSAFRKQFSKGSTALADASLYPPAEEIRATFDRVYQQAMVELPNTAPAALDEPVDEPYFAWPTKLGALLLSSHHEMLHAGQIGLLRRLLGKLPIR